MLLDAVKNGNLKMANLFVLSASENAKNNALVEAAKGGYFNIVHMLMNNGADINYRNDELYTPLMAAAQTGKYETVLALLPYAGLEVDKKGTQGMNALHLAAQNGYLDIVKALIETGEADVRAETVSLAEPLHFAAAGGHDDIVTYLISKGAKVDASGGAKGDTPLILAARNGNFSTVKLLINTHDADVNARNDTGQNVLLAALELGAGFTDIALWLVKEGGSKVNKCDGLGRSAVFYAAAYKDLVLAQALISKGADVNEPDNGGATPLMSATVNNDAAMMELLLDNKANVDAQDNVYYGKHNNCTALMYAVQYGNAEAVKLLLEHGASVHTVNQANETALMLVGSVEVRSAAMYMWDVAKLYDNNVPSATKLQIAQLLLDNGADESLDFVDRYAMTAMDHALEDADLKALLLKYGAKTYREMVAQWK
ncbi:Putative ankyrin repeat protein [uncultured archaeon]|nr:Putative ankyrin repeat protein [uncultured archaeon]